MTSSIRGRFVWHELMTADPARSKSFYEKLVGWSSESWGQDATYQLWMNGKNAVGGYMELPPEVKQAGAPSHWLSYVGTPDADATCRDAVALGATILKEPWDIPTVGRIGVVSDPAGAVFCVFTPGGEAPGSNGSPGVGDFSWHELATTDPAGAMQFYGSLFGWTPITEFDMGPAGPYRIFGLGDTMLGGVYQRPPEVPVSNWLPYAMVKDADAAVERARGSGATILHGPMEVPGGDRVAVGVDPTGAVFAIHAKAAA